MNLRKLMDPRRRRKPAPVPELKKQPQPAAGEPDRFDAARDRLRAEIPPPDDDDA